MAMCRDVFAQPMPDNDKNYLKNYIKQLLELRQDGYLPRNLKKEMTYKVYSIKGSSCGVHKSIVLSSDDRRFFSMELGFVVVEGVKRIYPVTQRIDSRYKSKLKYHGEVKLSTGTLLSQGVATMKKFGNYFKFCNNCQDFCNMYLEAIGLGDKKTMTDGDKAAVISLALGSALSVVAILLMLILKK